MILKKILEKNPVIPAIKDDLTLKEALKSSSEIVFVIIANILEISKICEKLKKQKKIVFIHVDMIDGLSSTNSGIDYIIKFIKPDGIITTKNNIALYAYKNNIRVIQRYFILDSFSYEKSLNNILENKSDAIEIMPGLMPKIIKKLSSKIKQPIITGGLISEKEDVINALKSGAISVSTTDIKLWKI